MCAWAGSIPFPARKWCGDGPRLSVASPPARHANAGASRTVFLPAQYQPPLRGEIVTTPIPDFQRSCVFLCQVAVKRFNHCADIEMVHSFKTEVYLLKNLNHANLVRFYGACTPLGANRAPKAASARSLPCALRDRIACCS